jgi:hypothetical protein
MTYRQAQAMLRTPRDWPTDLVRSATDHLGTRLAKQKPVLTVAEFSGWKA